MLDELKDLSALMPAVQYLDLNLGIPLVLLIAGWSVSSLAGRSVRKLAARASRVDPTIVPMVYTVTVWAIRSFVLFAVKNGRASGRGREWRVVEFRVVPGTIKKKKK